MKLNVAVFFGSTSVEHEISVISALQCINALDLEKYRVFPIYISKEGAWYTGNKLLQIENYKDMDKLLSQCEKIYFSLQAGNWRMYKDSIGLFGRKLIAQIDVAFPVVHGTNGEDGTLQGLFELMQIPYVGGNVLSMALTKDKIATKFFLRDFGFPVLDAVWFYSHEWMKEREKVFQKILAKFHYPLMVKPANLGSTVGVQVANNEQELEEALDLISTMTTRIIVEPKLVNFREINCSILGDSESQEVSVCEEPIHTGDFLSYKDKYMSGGDGKSGKLGGGKLGGKLGGDTSLEKKGMSSAKRQIPADLPFEVTQRIQELARKAFITCDCAGVVRIDFLIDQDTNQIYLCEINPIPGSLSFYLWAPLEKDFTQLTDQLIEVALKRYREQKQLTRSFGTNILNQYSASGMKGGMKGGTKGKL